MTEIHTRLRGMAWSHRRGIEPLRACARLLKAQGISIEWDARSLQGFEEATILDLGKTYDLIAIDHPFMGQAFRDRALLPVDEIVGADFVDELKAQSVGPSLESYIWRNRLWAIPVDAAAQVAAFRADLLARAGVTVPTSWREVLALAGTVPVALAANPTTGVGRRENQGAIEGLQQGGQGREGFFERGEAEGREGGEILVDRGSRGSKAD